MYDRVNKWGGAERVLLVLHEIFPDAPLYTSVYDSNKASWASVFPKVHTSFLQKIPILKNHHELLGWLTPLAYETFSFSDYDLVISVTSEAAKGIITKPQTRHICICLTPTRYLWSGYREYLKNPSRKLSWIPFYRFISWPFLSYVKMWDKVASQRPDIIISISNAVKERVRRYYERDSEVVFPPVEIEKFQIPNYKLQINSKFKTQILKEGKYHLIVSRLVPYKKVDLAIEAFNILGQPLVIVGTGSEEKRLKSIANKNINFAGFVEDADLFYYYKNARALIYPQEEDFGITAVEAQASGVPIIAYKAGGALDTVIDGKTGIFFEKQNVNSVISAVRKFEKLRFSKSVLFKNAKKFSKEKFVSEFKKYLISKV